MENRNLQLSLKTKWFEMTKAGIKTEDYREITPYWIARLFNISFYDSMENLKNEYTVFKNRPASWDKNCFADSFKSRLNYYTYKDQCFKSFKTNTMTLGYPKAGDTERILKLEHKGIEIRTGNPDWGAEPGKLYFVIKHGNTILH